MTPSTPRRAPERFIYFATCAPGAEPYLHAEAKALGLSKHERQVGGVYFEGTERDGWRANLWLRSAVRILRRVGRFEAQSEAQLDAGVAAVDWARYLQPHGRLWIDAQARDSTLNHSLFLAQRVKDTIVDQLRSADGTRPEVDRDDPDLRVHLHLFRDRATLAVDTSGASLHLRGWRVAQGRAPLAETLAATVVLASGWDRRAPLIDPFCGSGTLLVEGALLAAGVAPGLTRARFGFESWQGHDDDAWQKERAAAIGARVAVPKLRLVAMDRDEERVDEAYANLTAVGFDEQCTFDVAEARDFAPRQGWNAQVISNLPYGERIGADEDVEALHSDFGAQLRVNASGYRAALLVGSPALARRLALQGERVDLINGGLEVVLLNAELR